MKIENLTLTFGTQVIFKDVSLRIKEKEKVGIVGVNGAGKTSFFKLITKSLEPDAGRIILPTNYRISLLPQVINESVPSMNITVFEYLISGRPIDKLNHQLTKAYEALATSSTEVEQKVLFNRINKIQKDLDYFESYAADAELLKIIDGMQIESALLEKPLMAISGGQKSKVAFARLLYSKPEVILLDEPTNHLDKMTRTFVLNYLKKYRGSIYVISHDISFLNELTTMTLLIDKKTKTMKLYEGNYKAYIKAHEAYEATLLKEATIQTKKAEALKTVINKYASASGKRKRMVKDRTKKLQKLMVNKIDMPSELKVTQLKMVMARESNDVPLKINRLTFRYDQAKELITNLSLELYRGERLLVVGINGAGKSTLLKLIVGKLKPTSGTITIGNKVDIAYYDQELEGLNAEQTILANFDDITISLSELRKALGRFLFYGDDVFKKVKVLSPGEKSRVALAKISLKQANFLILDEPTNHLDPETQTIVAETLATFKGTMLVVSHNPTFVDQLGINKILRMPDNTLLYYDKKEVERFQKINNK